MTQPQDAPTHNGQVLRERLGMDEPRLGHVGTFPPPPPDPLAELQERWQRLCDGNMASLIRFNDERGWRLWSHHVHPHGSYAERERLAKREWSETELRVRIIGHYFAPLYRCERGGLGDVWRALPREWLWERIYDPTKWRRRLTKTAVAFLGGTAEMEYSLIPASALKSVTALATLSKTARTEIAAAKEDGDPVIEGLLVASAMQQMRQLITEPMMTGVMALQGSPLGFETDDKGPYPIDVVKDVFIQAQLCGARPVGNEFGIMSRKFYPKAGFFRRQIEETEGVTDVLVEPGDITKASDDYAQVEMFVSWRRDGKLQKYEAIKKQDGDHAKDLRIRVKVNRGMGADAVIGKAERKVLARVHRIVTGNVFVPEEVDEDTIEGEVIQPAPEAEPPVTDDGGSSAPAEDFALEEHRENCQTLYSGCDTAEDCVKVCEKINKGATKAEREISDAACKARKAELSQPKGR